MNRLELTNSIRLEAEQLDGTDFPLEIFPQKMQHIILDLTQIEKYNMEYLAISMLSAAATAIGNSCQIRIQGSWKNSPALYIILVGRPGQGKTPPLDYAYRPLQEHDYQLFCKFKDDYEAYISSLGKGKKDCETPESEKPILRQTILSDFTPESMMRIHNDNQRGIVILVDEIMGFFNSIYRYNDNPLITQLLTAYSGKQLKVSRCNSPIPIIIQHPCINIIGTTQTKRICELFTKENMANGLIDRILFLCPKSRKIARVDETPDATSTNDSADVLYRQWKTIIDKLLSLECDNGESSKVLTMAEEAQHYFWNWKNGLIDQVNAIDDDSLIDSRMMKADSNVARLALVFQVLRWACDESHIQFVDEKSIHAAIRLYDYLETSYLSITATVKKDSLGTLKRAYLNQLPSGFSTSDAITAGCQFGLCESTVKKDLAKWVEERVLQKDAHGKYSKLI